MGTALEWRRDTIPDWDRGVYRGRVEYTGLVWARYRAVSTGVVPQTEDPDTPRFLALCAFKEVDPSSMNGFDAAVSDDGLRKVS